MNKILTYDEFARTFEMTSILRLNPTLTKYTQLDESGSSPKVILQYTRQTDGTWHNTTAQAQLEYKLKFLQHKIRFNGEIK